MYGPGGVDLDGEQHVYRRHDGRLRHVTTGRRRLAQRQRGGQHHEQFGARFRQSPQPDLQRRRQRQRLVHQDRRGRIAAHRHSDLRRRDFVNSGVLRLGAFVPGPSLSGLGANTSATGVNSTITNGTWSFTTNGGGYTTTPLTGGTLTLTDNVGGEARSAIFREPGARRRVQRQFRLRRCYRGQWQPSRRDRGDAPKRQPRSQRVGRRWRSTGVHQRQRRNADRPQRGSAPEYLQRRRQRWGWHRRCGKRRDGLYLYCTRIGEPGERRSDSGQSKLRRLQHAYGNFLGFGCQHIVGHVGCHRQHCLDRRPFGISRFFRRTGGAESTQTISNFNYLSLAPPNAGYILPAATALTIASGGTVDLNGGPGNGRLACRLGRHRQRRHLGGHVHRRRSRFEHVWRHDQRRAWAGRFERVRRLTDLKRHEYLHGRDHG